MSVSDDRNYQDLFSEVNIFNKSKKTFFFQFFWSEIKFTAIPSKIFKELSWKTKISKNFWWVFSDEFLIVLSGKFLQHFRRISENNLKIHWFIATTMNFWWVFSNEFLMVFSEEFLQHFKWIFENSLNFYWIIAKICEFSNTHNKLKLKF